MIKIAVGCGKRDYGRDWFHVDGDTTFPHVTSNDVGLITWKDETVDLIYACHLLNYFEKDEAIEYLRQWRSKLKVGGVLRLAVPNFNKMCRLYWESGIVRLRDIRGPLMGNWQMGDIRISHKSVWDWEEMDEALSEAGFGSYNTYDWRDTDHANIDDHSQSYLLPKGDKVNGTLISLNIEATK